MNRQDLLKKWAPILESESAPKIADNYRKEVTAVLLENQEREMAKQSEALFEAVPANAGGTGVGRLRSSIDRFSSSCSSTINRL